MKGGRLYLLKISVPNSTVNTYLKLLPEISECFGGSFWWIFLVDIGGFSILALSFCDFLYFEETEHYYPYND